MVEFRDVVKKYAGTDEALGVPAGTVGGIPVVTPDDLGPAAAMTPAEVVTDEDAQAALSATFVQAKKWSAVARMSRLTAWDSGYGSGSAWSQTDSGAAVTPVGAGTWTRSASGIQVAGGGGTAGTPPAVARIAGTGGLVRATGSFWRAATTLEGFAFRVKDANNFFVAGLNSARNIEVGQWIAGTYTSLATTSFHSGGDLRNSTHEIEAGCMASNAGVWLWVVCAGARAIAEVTDAGVLAALTSDLDSGLALGFSAFRASDLAFRRTTI